MNLLTDLSITNMIYEGRTFVNRSIASLKACYCAVYSSLRAVYVFAHINKLQRSSLYQYLLGGTLIHFLSIPINSR